MNIEKSGDRTYPFWQNSWEAGTFCPFLCDHWSPMIGRSPNSSAAAGEWALSIWLHVYHDHWSQNINDLSYLSIDERMTRFETNFLKVTCEIHENYGNGNEISCLQTFPEILVKMNIVVFFLNFFENIDYTFSQKCEIIWRQRLQKRYFSDNPCKKFWELEILRFFPGKRIFARDNEIFSQ